jgi:hypothetical protein
MFPPRTVEFDLFINNILDAARQPVEFQGFYVACGSVAVPGLILASDEAPSILGSVRCVAPI